MSDGDGENNCLPASIDPDKVTPVGTLSETKVWLTYGAEQKHRYDCNGFLHSDRITSTSAPSETDKDAWRMARRVQKWRKMLGPGGLGFEDYISLKPQRSEKLKRRVRKGIPEQVGMNGIIHGVKA